MFAVFGVVIGVLGLDSWLCQIPSGVCLWSLLLDLGFPSVFADILGLLSCRSYLSWFLGRYFPWWTYFTCMCVIRHVGASLGASKLVRAFSGYSFYDFGHAHVRTLLGASPGASKLVREHSSYFISLQALSLFSSILF